MKWVRDSKVKNMATGLHAQKDGVYRLLLLYASALQTAQLPRGGMVSPVNFPNVARTMFIALSEKKPNPRSSLVYITQ